MFTAYENLCGVELAYVLFTEECVISSYHVEESGFRFLIYGTFWPLLLSLLRCGTNVCVNQRSPLPQPNESSHRIAFRRPTPYQPAITSPDDTKERPRIAHFFSSQREGWYPNRKHISDFFRPYRHINRERPEPAAAGNINTIMPPEGGDTKRPSSSPSAPAPPGRDAGCSCGDGEA